MAYRFVQLEVCLSGPPQMILGMPPKTAMVSLPLPVVVPVEDPVEMVS